MGAFDAWATRPTIARLFSAPGAVIRGAFTPTLQQFPIQSSTQATRWGFREFFNGYVFGPEGTSLELLQAAVDAGKLKDIPGGLGIQPGTRLTALDFEDSRYLQAPDGSSSVYAYYVRGQAAPPVDSPAPPPPAPPPFQPPSPPPVVPPPAGSGLSAPEQRVDELWAWIGQQWPTVRPVAVAALKMFRKAVGR